MTRRGIEYAGTVSETAAGHQCRSWAHIGKKNYETEKKNRFCICLLLSEIEISLIEKVLRLMMGFNEKRIRESSKK